MSGIPNAIPATASTFLGIPASNARFWGRRPFDFQLDVENPGRRTKQPRNREPEPHTSGARNQTRPSARQKTHQRHAPGEPDRRGQKGQGGRRTLVSPFTFLEGPVLGSAPFLCGSVLGSAPFVSCVLKRQRSISSFALRTPTRRFVSRAVKADTRSVLGSAPFGERVRRELSEHPLP